MELINLLHKHWKIIAYDQINNGNYIQPVFVTVKSSDSEEEAINKAKEMIVRVNYVLSEVYECSACFYEEEKNRALKKILKNQHE